MRYRIVEYQIAQPETGYKFFVEVGKTYKEKVFGPFYVTKTNWALDAGFKTKEDALERIYEIKKAEPIYHIIK